MKINKQLLIEEWQSMEIKSIIFSLKLDKDLQITISVILITGTIPGNHFFSGYSIFFPEAGVLR